VLYLLLIGGDKGSQKHDIKRAIAMARTLLKEAMTNFTPFDVADYLENEEVVAAYLSAALEDPDPDAFLVAVKAVARARGLTQLAKDSGLGARRPLQGTFTRCQATLRNGDESSAGC
jgi:probable addiction module antidote protein